MYYIRACDIIDITHSAHTYSFPHSFTSTLFFPFIYTIFLSFLLSHFFSPLLPLIIFSKFQDLMEEDCYNANCFCKTFINV